MSCDWTEKISLLIDGELPPLEARTTESHVETCAACRRTKEDFLSLREAVSSYPLSADPAAERRALEKILAAGTQAPRAVAPPPQPPSWRELLRLPRLTPALASALAVLVLAVALGVVWSVSRRDARQKLVAEGTRQDGAQQSAQVTPPNAPAPTAPAPDKPSDSAAFKNTHGGGSDSERKAASAPSANESRTGGGRGKADVARRRQATPPAGGARVEVASGAPATRQGSPEDALAEFRPLFVAAGSPAGDEFPRVAPEATDDTPRGDTARHFEQAQRLLRSVRNARAGERPGSIADERQRSQNLLYRNIVLRREAARAGNAPVERALDSLEPLLIDIANLPDSPGREDVTVIQERMRKKNIVAVLQANLAAVPRTYY